MMDLPDSAELPLDAPPARPFRVLSLDGGGMRGTYTATYLCLVAEAFALRRGVQRLDIGTAFDLIVGTSTGGIIACALAAGVQLEQVITLYTEHGHEVFSRPIPARSVGAIWDLCSRPKALARGTAVLRATLERCFGGTTIADVYRTRKIALAITAVEMSQHRSWVFKTPHLQATTNNRDDKYRLVDVCLATSAAPLYRSLAALDYPNGSASGYHVFADGGLWANNPVLVGMVDALEMAEKHQPIEIFCLGTCPRPAGEPVQRSAVDRGLSGWKFGGLAAGLSIDAQEFAYDNMARMLAKHLDWPCRVVRFPRGAVPASMMEYLDMDDTRREAIDALVKQARTDADMTNSICGDSSNEEGRLICNLFQDPAMKPAPV